MEYTPHTHKDVERMLAQVGAGSLQELFAAIPESARLEKPLDLPASLSEPELLLHMSAIAGANRPATEMISFLGGGIYDHFIPSVVPALVGRSEFYTAYTPYQPEISQGMLQAIFEFQTATCQLLGMDAANASMYDGASALAEAIIMALEATNRSQVLVPRSVNPLYREVLATYLEGQDCQLIELPWENGHVSLSELQKLVGDDTAAVVVQHPNFFGVMEPVEEIERLVHGHRGLLIVDADPIAAAMLKSPGELGADIAVAEGQSLGIPMAYGGPLVGLFACRQELVRRMPGRIVGRTTDSQGRIAYCLTLQAREQHIRREKATSNICTNESLCALTALIYMATMGAGTLPEVANQCLQKAHYTQEKISAIPGFALRFASPFFREFAVRTPIDPVELNRGLRERGILGGIPLGTYFSELSDTLLMAVTERRTREEIDRAAAAFAEVASERGK